MKKFNNKGFTLVEIIAVVAVMGVLSGTAVVGVSSSIKKSHDEYCTSIVDMMTLAGRDYFQDNRSKLPLSIEKEESVSLKDLIDQKYIDPIKDYDDNDCPIDEDNKVKVQKQFGNDYYYTTYLKCNKCSTSNTNPENISTPNITFSPSGGNYTNKDVNVTVDITDDKNDITSYEYEIQKKQDNDSYTSIKKVTKGNVNDKNVTFNVKLNSKGTYKVKVTAFNSVFQRAEKTGGPYTLNYTLNCNKQLTISAKVDNKNIQEKTWYNGVMTFVVSAKGAIDRYDVYVDGKKMNSNFLTKSTTTYTKGNDQTAKHEVKAIAYDDQGNSCTQSAEYWQDNIAPTCSSNDSSDKWYNKNVNLPITCTDNESGCKDTSTKFEVNQEGTYTKNINVSDKAGNVGHCSVTINVDKTPPTCSVSLSGTPGNNGYYLSGVTASLAVQDDRSGVIGYDISGINDATYNGQSSIYFANTNSVGLLAYGHVKDKAGNVGICKSSAINIDLYDPTCSLKISGKKGKNDWYTSNVEIDYKSVNEVGSGISSCSGNSKCSGKITTYKDDTSNYTYTATVTDKAGRSGTCSISFKKDSTPPTISFNQNKTGKITGLDGKKHSVSINKYGDCDKDCYSKDTLGRRNSYYLQQKEKSAKNGAYVCFNVVTTSPNGKYTCINKEYTCGSLSIDRSDQTSGIDSFTEALIGSSGDVILNVEGKDSGYKAVDNFVYTAIDKAGNSSQFYISYLSTHHLRHTTTNATDGVRMTDFTNNYKCTNSGWAHK